MHGVHVVGGSNPLAPTNFFEDTIPRLQSILIQLPSLLEFPLAGSILPFLPRVLLRVFGTNLSVTR